MRTVDEWRAALRGRLREAMSAKDPVAVAVVRETMAAIDNAEAPPMVSGPADGGGAFAGSVSGAGSSEVARLALTPAEVAAVVEREIGERRAAAADYARLGRHEDAARLVAQADVLAELLAGGA